MIPQQESHKRTDLSVKCVGAMGVHRGRNHVGRRRLPCLRFLAGEKSLELDSELFSLSQRGPLNRALRGGVFWGGRFAFDRGRHFADDV